MVKVTPSPAVCQCLFYQTGSRSIPGAERQVHLGTLYSSYILLKQYNHISTFIIFIFALTTAMYCSTCYFQWTWSSSILVFNVNLYNYAPLALLLKLEQISSASFLNRLQIQNLHWGLTNCENHQKYMSAYSVQFWRLDSPHTIIWVSDKVATRRNASLT